MCTPSRRLLSRTFKIASSAGAIAAVFALAGTTWAGEKRNDEVFSLKTVIPIPGNNLVSFDISWVDPVIHKYFLADRNNKSIDVIKHTDTKTPTFDTQIIPPAAHAFAGTPGVPACTGTPGVGPNDCAGPDGVLTLNDTHGRELWVGDGPTDDASCTPPPPATGFTPCSTVKVFPAGASGAAVPSHTIPTFGHARSDEICFDPADHLVMVANNADSPPFASLISTTNYTVVAKIPFDGSDRKSTRLNSSH